MEDQNSREFLAAFHRIEKEMKKIISQDDYLPFASMLRKAETKSAILRQYRNELLDYASLRNAIVHERIDPNMAIAEPHIKIVEKIKKIESNLINPRTVYQAFQGKVYYFDQRDKLSELLKGIREKQYTQFPIFSNNDFVGLISENGITHWLAQNVEEELIDLTETPLLEILKYEESKENYKFLTRNSPVAYAAEIFKNSIQNDKRIDAILITENGKAQEKLLGIITSWDILNLS